MKSADEVEKEKWQATLDNNEVHIKWLKIFEKFAQKNCDKLDFDFLIIYADQFNSGFRKQEFGNIEIVFPELQHPCTFKSVSNVLTSEKSKGEKFFFIYYTRKKEGEVLSIMDLVNDLLGLSTSVVVSNRLK